MNQMLCRKTFCIALFMVIAMGIQPVFADDAEDLAEARAAVAAAETAVEEAREAFTQAETEAVNAVAAVEEARVALEEAETALEEARTALARVEASTGTDPALEEADEALAEAEEALEEGDLEAAEEALAEAEEALDEEVAEATPIDDSIQYNEYFLESQRLLELAREANDEGDYDAATEYAEEAARFAQLSDEYIAQQMGETVLPATYTVRTWAAARDCFWIIAGYPWIYGDSFRWRVLYEANKSKLENPDNPNLIEPGTVLDIPSIKGETRRGAWVSGKVYPALP